MARFIHKRLAWHPGRWRVDDIGPVRARGRLRRGATVFYFGLTEEGLGKPYWKSSLNAFTLPLSVHSASLREFKVGSIWQEGKQIAAHFFLSCCSV